MSETEHIGKMIEQVLKEKERSVAWLARRIGCDRSNLRKMLQQPFIHTSNLWRISQILEYDFFQGYSSDIQDYMKIHK